MILPHRQQGRISSDKGLYQNPIHIKAPFPHMASWPLWQHHILKPTWCHVPNVPF